MANAISKMFKNVYYFLCVDSNSSWILNREKSNIYCVTLLPLQTRSSCNGRKWMKSQQFVNLKTVVV